MSKAMGKAIFYCLDMILSISKAPSTSIDQWDIRLESKVCVLQFTWNDSMRKLPFACFPLFTLGSRVRPDSFPASLLSLKLCPKKFEFQKNKWISCGTNWFWFCCDVVLVGKTDCTLTSKYQMMPLSSISHLMVLACFSTLSRGIAPKLLFLCPLLRPCHVWSLQDVTVNQGSSAAGRGTAALKCPVSSGHSAARTDRSDPRDGCTRNHQDDRCYVTTSSPAIPSWFSSVVPQVVFVRKVWISAFLAFR